MSVSDIKKKCIFQNDSTFAPLVVHLALLLIVRSHVDVPLATLSILLTHLQLLQFLSLTKKGNY